MIHVVGNGSNEVVVWLEQEGFSIQTYPDPLQAIMEIPDGSVLMVLAEGYPMKKTNLEGTFFTLAEQKGIRYYIEYPSEVPGMVLPNESLRTRLERGVVVQDVFGAGLRPMSILGINDCHVIQVNHDDPLLVLAKVAGLDKAEYGIDDVETYPLLIKHQSGLVAFTKLSNFAAGRYGPEDHWQTVWGYIIRELIPGARLDFQSWPTYLQPAFDQDETITTADKENSVEKGVEWFAKGRFYVHPDWKEMWLEYQGDGANPVGPPVARDLPNGDGTLGLLEGHSSNIYHDGTQQYRYWIRADVQGEGAYALAAAGNLLNKEDCFSIAGNLVDYIFRENLRNGPRSHPDSASYGLIGWSHTHPGVYYGDDNARAILGILGASAHMGTDRWDKETLEAILANFRTTGTLGFRDRRLEQRDLQRQGWRYYRNREVVNPAPHFESWMWALYLWLYDKTGYEPLLEKAKSAIRITMEMYPDEWLWTNGIQQERARMILPLAWLVRIEDTAEHREWLDRIVSKLLENQVESGAIREELGGVDKGRYGRTKSNQEYGLHEAPLIFENGDPIADMLYTSNFAFFSLNEAAHATGEERYQEALEKLSDFLTRIQVKSDKFEDLDGAWFRAFDFDRWEFWASNADVGWGAWGTLTGWTQSWIVGTQVLVLQNQSYWELTNRSAINAHMDETLDLMMEELR
ncbi:hypothetical protein [Negadavirga shengliensis]|uniref:Uncharacterized protein n=1 Tax=Negadavirga shengliensis TaxID=1389218 RepID=A0ABV9T215_9BACT